MANQLSLFDDIFSDNNAPNFVNIRDGEYIYYPSFFSKLDSDIFFEKLKKNINWKQESMNLYGKNVLFPRLTAWHGDNDKAYSFSGITLNPRPWNQELLTIKESIEKVSKVVYNSVLLNLYRNGNDSISWHTDAEKELGKNPIISSVNFGATRKFQLRHNITKERIDISLTHGSLLIMLGGLQHFWQHQVPKTNQDVTERINLTFRTIL